MRLALSRLVRLVSPELLVGLFHGLVWLLLALEVSRGVVSPLAQVVRSLGADGGQ